MSRLPPERASDYVPGMDAAPPDAPPDAPIDAVPLAVPLIALDAVGVRAGARWLVRDVSLHVARGEIVTLIGPNGSGKSTVVRAALGLTQAAEGSVARARGLTVGYVPQSLGRGNELPMDVTRLMRLTGRLPARDVAAALGRVGAAHLARARVSDLSGGERQRVLLARAIARQPDLLVLDEPVQGVDVAGEALLYALIDAIRTETGCGVLLVSHDLHVVMARTTRVICLNGHVCCEGTPDAVLASPAYASLFGPRSDTHALYRHHHDHAHH